MERVLSHAAEAGAKVVLVGDPEQLQAIEASAAFRALADRHGAAEITQVRRQHQAGWTIPRTSQGADDMVAAFARTMEMLLLEHISDPDRSAVRCGGHGRAYGGMLWGSAVGREFWDKSPARGPARGFVLTCETAELLADAAPPATDPWRRRVFALPPQGEGFGGVYVDVPHGALLISGTQQLRAIFAVPFCCPMVGG